MFDVTQLTTDQQTLLSTYWGYESQIPDPANPGQTIANPQSLQDFLNQQVIGLVNNVIQEQYNRNLLDGVREDQVPLIVSN